jgi:hypothetical protein
MEHNKFGHELRFSANDAKVIKDFVSKEYPGVVEAHKEFLENQLRGPLFAVYKRLTGEDLKSHKGYWPRRIANVDQTDISDLPNVEEITKRHLEDLGIVQHRSEGATAPIMIGDFFTEFSNHVQSASAIINMAEPVKVAESVLLARDVQGMIVNKYGDKALSMVQDYLREATMILRKPKTRLEKISTFLNSNAARALLKMNPSPLLKQFGGLFKLMDKIPLEYLTHGISNMFSTEAFNEAVEHSPMIWARYNHYGHRMFSPTLGHQSNILGETTVKEDLIHSSRGHLIASMQNLVDKLKGMEWADSTVVRAAWSGYKKMAEDKYPDWSKSERMRWVVEMTNNAIRETQNSASPLDLSIVQSEARKNPITASLFMFTSDSNKSLNMVVQGFKRGKREGMRAASAVMTNNIWAAVVGTIVGKAAWSMLKAASGNDEEEPMKENAKFFGKQMARNVVGMAYGGNIVYNIAEGIFGKSYFSDKGTPPSQGMRDFVDGLILLGRGVHRVFSDEDGAVDAIVGGLIKSSEGTGVIAGYPIYPIRFMKKVNQAINGEENDGKKGSRQGRRLRLRRRKIRE